ncbi:hypothetical protein GF420_15800 [candidate division GN15 bacterium]|nr:hypothetical protein [candidate division GN15 bacterium]
MTRKQTETILRSMLTEGVPTSILDSGGAYGYHFEDHRRTDEYGEEAWEEDNPPATLEDGLVTISLYAFLLERVEYCKEEDQKFQNFCEERDVAGLYAQRAYLEFLQEAHGDLSSFEPGWEPDIINSYNSENSLDQTIQFFVWADPEGSRDHYICLSIHGGCDVRGGYTHPRIFLLDCDELTDIIRWANVYLSCELCDAGWYSDNGGYDWYPNQRGYGRMKGDEIKMREVVTVDDDGDENVEVTDDHLCPHCGDGILSASFL